MARRPPTPLDRLPSGEMPRFRRHTWQANAFRLLLTGRKGPFVPTSARQQAFDAYHEAPDVLVTLRAIHDFSRIHGSLHYFFANAAGCDRMVVADIRGLTMAGRFRKLAQILAPERIERLLGSPLFCRVLFRAWTTAAEDLPREAREVAAAREFLRTVAELLAAPLQERPVHRLVKRHRAEAAAHTLHGRLPFVLFEVRQMDKASKGLRNRSEIREALVRWQVERDRLQREEDARNGTPSIGGTATVGPVVSCPTCKNERFGMAATALAAYRRRHAQKERRGPIPLREVAAAVLLHRCPDTLDARAVRTALARLKKRETLGTRT